MAQQNQQNQQGQQGQQGQQEIVVSKVKDLMEPQYMGKNKTVEVEVLEEITVTRKVKNKTETKLAKVTAMEERIQLINERHRRCS